MPSLNDLNVNEVWQLKQMQAKAHTNPPQPMDDSKELRYYLIIGVTNTKDLVTCCPIQNSTKGIYGHEVPLSLVDFPFLQKDSKVICSDLFTLPDLWFLQKIGEINNQPVLSKIHNHLKRYLKIP